MISSTLLQHPRLKRIRSKYGKQATSFFELLGEPDPAVPTEVRPMRAQLEARHPGIKDIDVVRIMQELEKADFGRFIPGRGTKRSRFEWTNLDSSRGMSYVSSQAIVPRPVATAPVVSQPTMTASAPDTHRISLGLRKDFTVDLQLPRDLTAEEAQRLSNLILALPTP